MEHHSLDHFSSAMQSLLLLKMLSCLYLSASLYLSHPPRFIIFFRLYMRAQSKESAPLLLCYNLFFFFHLLSSLSPFCMASQNHSLLHFVLFLFPFYCFPFIFPLYYYNIFFFLLCMENMELRKFLEFGTKSVCSPPVSFFLHCTAISQLDGHNNTGIHMLRSNLRCFGKLLVWKLL